jgi:hypothetical protein
VFNFKYRSAMRLESTFGAQLLKACGACRAQGVNTPHPLAMNPRPADTFHCPACGAPSARAEVREGEGKWLDPFIHLADAFLRAGAWLFKQAERI